jgi:hypothetical protein
LKTIVNNGDTVKWKTYSISTNIISTSSTEDSSGEKSLILFQGVPNTDHILKIGSSGGDLSSISMIKVYRPYWNR